MTDWGGTVRFRFRVRVRVRTELAGLGLGLGQVRVRKIRVVCENSFEEGVGAGEGGKENSR